MAEKTKLKWLRKEFSSSEELEYYLTQLKHQDKLKSDIIALLERFQHLLFQDYDPDSLTITYNGQWDVNFASTSIEDAKQKMAAATSQASSVKVEPIKEDVTKEDIKKNPKTTDLISKLNKAENKFSTKQDSKIKSGRSSNKEESKNKFSSKTIKEEKKTKRIGGKGERIDLTDLLNANLLSVGAKLKHKTQGNISGTVTREGNFKLGKEEYRSLSGAATSLVNSGRRDGWLCWLFQDVDGEWKPVDLLRVRWKQKFLQEK